MVSESYRLYFHFYRILVQVSGVVALELDGLYWVRWLHLGHSVHLVHFDQARYDRWERNVKVGQLKSVIFNRKET